MTRNQKPASGPSACQALRTDVEVHVAGFAERGAMGRLFVGSRGGIPRRRNFNRVWKKALADAGVPASIGLHTARPEAHREHVVGIAGRPSRS
jgi:hypothetical protein